MEAGEEHRGLRQPRGLGPGYRKRDPAVDIPRPLDLTQVASQSGLQVSPLLGQVDLG